MVFARKSDAALTSLVKKLNEAIDKHADDKLQAFVNLIGEDREALETSAKELGEESESKLVPIVVPVEHENGPENFSVHPDAEVTVMLYSGVEVKANHAFAEGELEEGIDKVLEGIPEILK